MDDVEDSAAIAEAVPARAGSQNGAGKSLQSEILFSQQFLLQQRLEDLRQELLTSFGDQRRHIQNVSMAVQRIAIQPVVRPHAGLPQPPEAQEV